MKNNSRARARARESDTKPATDVKSGKFFPAPFPDKSAREGNELWAQTGSENVSLFVTSMKRASRRTGLLENIWQLF